MEKVDERLIRDRLIEVIRKCYPETADPLSDFSVTVMAERMLALGVFASPVPLYSQFENGDVLDSIDVQINTHGIGNKYFCKVSTRSPNDENSIIYCTTTYDYEDAQKYRKVN